MQITNTRNKLSFSAIITDNLSVAKQAHGFCLSTIAVDKTNIAKMGTAMAKKLKVALPIIQEFSDGVSVLLTNKRQDNQDLLTIISTTKRSVGGFLGFFEKYGKCKTVYKYDKNDHNLTSDYIVQLIRKNIKSARKNLLLKFECKYGTPSERAIARNKRITLNKLKGSDTKKIQNITPKSDSKIESVINKIVSVKRKLLLLVENHQSQANIANKRNENEAFDILTEIVNKKKYLR